ncbi:hypothetical protein CL619_00950 [archaeon]|nr:hypothetical protein [archaeon]|tara:strand:- start:1700 stop:2359 length:660 start_codon:yes stop_codon:yes gene_type:complete
MALFPGQTGAGGHLDVDAEVHTLRSQGLTDDQILSELTAKGAKEQQVISSLSKLGAPGAPGMGAGGPPAMPGMPPSPPGQGMGPGISMPPPSSPPTSHGAGPTDSPQDLYDRIEEITEEMIDEKWDDLIKEVRKIVEWKNSVESKMQKMDSDLSKLKDDFKILHQGVIGKVEEYDKRMQEVGTELKAVGKVFKDVVPVFTENVKELRSITSGMREGKKE